MFLPKAKDPLLNGTLDSTAGLEDSWLRATSIPAGFCSTSASDPEDGGPFLVFHLVISGGLFLFRSLDT